MWAERGRYPVSTMARLLGVSRSDHCSWLDAGGHLDPLAGLKDVVAALWEGSGGAFVSANVKPADSANAYPPVAPTNMRQSRQRFSATSTNDVA